MEGKFPWGLGRAVVEGGGFGDASSASHALCSCESLVPLLTYRGQSSVTRVPGSGVRGRASGVRGHASGVLGCAS